MVICNNLFKIANHCISYLTFIILFLCSKVKAKLSQIHLFYLVVLNNLLKLDVQYISNLPFIILFYVQKTFNIIHHMPSFSPLKL